MFGERLNAHKRNEGRFTAMNGPPDRSGSQRSRSSDSSICRTRTASGTFNAASVWRPNLPSASSPCRSWKRLTACASSAL